MLRPVAGVCKIAEKQRRKNAQTNTEIRHGKWNNKRVGFRAEISSAANKEDCKSISSDCQKWKNPAKNRKPGLHLHRRSQYEANRGTRLGKILPNTVDFYFFLSDW